MNLKIIHISIESIIIQSQTSVLEEGTLGHLQVTQTLTFPIRWTSNIITEIVQPLGDILEREKTSEFSFTSG